MALGPKLINIRYDKNFWINNSKITFQHALDNTNPLRYMRENA